MLPCSRWRSHRASASGVSRNATTATVAATAPTSGARTPPRASRAASAPTATSPDSPTARDTSSHSCGAASPKGASSAVTRTGSGFQAIVPSELRVPRVSSRPQISHTHGS